MKHHTLTFIGELPPPYNGVVVKNQMVLRYIFQDTDVQFIDLVECRRTAWKIPIIFCRIVISMVTSQFIMIGVGTTFRRKVLLLLQRVLTGKYGMKKVMLLVMGGKFHIQVAQDKLLRNLVQQIESLWVETEEMVEAMKNMGIEQTYFFPNTRDEQGSKPPRKREEDLPLKLVYFTGINKEKGADIVMNAYQILKKNNVSVTLDFYGEVSPDIKESFENFISLGGGEYHGVYDAINDDVYSELNQYDIMLLPTHWKGEGVSGALIESKMAGITAIVSDWHANSEVIRNNYEGIVLSQITAEVLAQTVMQLCKDIEKVEAMKREAYTSRCRYCTQRYRQSMLDHVH